MNPNAQQFPPTPQNMPGMQPQQGPGMPPQQIPGMQPPMPNSQGNFNLSPAPKRRSKKPLAVLVILLVLLAAGGAAYALLHKKSTTTSPQTQTSQNSQQQATDSSLYAYIAPKSQKLLVTDSQQKTLATLKLPSGKDSFAVLANSGQTALIGAESDANGPDANADLYIISSEGKTTQLPATFSSALNTAMGNAGQFAGHLDANNNYLYTSCSSDSSMLNSINVTTGTSTVIYTASPCTRAVYDEVDPPVLLGVSPDGIAYLVIYANDQDTVGTLTLVDTKTQKVVSSFPMADESTSILTISPDYKHLIYTPTANQSSGIDVMDTTTGKTTTITSSNGNATAGAPYVWSPDSTKAAFVSGDTTGTTDKQQQVMYLTVATGKITALDGYGSPKLNNLTLDGWASNTQLSYLLTKSTTPTNDFTNGTKTSYVLDTRSNTATKKSVIAGYRLLVVGNFSLGF